MRTLLVLTLTMAAAGATEDALGRYAIAAQDFQAALFSNVVGHNLWVPGAPAALQHLDAQGRVEAVKALGAVAQAYTGTTEFAQRYAAWRASAIGAPPSKPPSYAQSVAETRRAAAQANQEMEAQLASLPPAQQAAVRAQLQPLRPPDGPANQAAYEKASALAYQRQLEEYQARQTRYPADANAAVKLALQRFLAATADVDFAAKRVPAGGREVFADEKHEAKSALWKAAYRAGRAPTQAARAFAQAWIKALP